jgi:hypothetical protein
VGIPFRSSTSRLPPVRAGPIAISVHRPGAVGASLDFP